MVSFRYIIVNTLHEGDNKDYYYYCDNINNNCTDAWIKSPTIHLRLNALELWNRKSSHPCADVTVTVVLILQLVVLFKCSCSLCSYNVFISSYVR
jgi:hypothetical protein